MTFAAGVHLRSPELFGWILNLRSASLAGCKRPLPLMPDDGILNSIPAWIVGTTWRAVSCAIIGCIF